MANKPKHMKPTDEDVKRAGELIKLGRDQVEAELEKLKEQLSIAPWIFELAGKIKGEIFAEAKARVLKLLFLKSVKDNKNYREQYGMTWEQFCKYVKIDRRRVDEQLADLKPYGVEFLAESANFLGYEIHKIKYLTSAISAESANFNDDSITYQGETIPLTPEHKDDIQALFEKLEESYKKHIEEKDATLRTKERLIASKDDVIHKQEKELGRLERQAKARGLKPEEDAFIQQMENLRLEIDLIMRKLDPEGIEALFKDNNPTPRMRAAYLTTLEYMKKQILAYYDTGHDLHSTASMSPEKVWKPGLKVV